MKSIVDDFASIKADLARIESDKKPKAEVTEGKATDWADVYGYTDVQKAYGWPYDAAQFDHEFVAFWCGLIEANSKI